MKRMLILLLITVIAACASDDDLEERVDVIEAIFNKHRHYVVGDKTSETSQTIRTRTICIPVAVPAERGDLLRSTMIWSIDTTPAWRGVRQGRTRQRHLTYLFRNGSY